ncbi:MAG: metal-dependent transcriptional regulator [Acutalibacter sp.]|jgi:DtxR family Mn-dependent transcriptional regulator
MELAKIQESAENYLETILILKERNGSVRSVDIAAEMGFSKPSVSVAMKNLREQECVTMGADGLIALTEKGQKIAEGVYERHTLFTQWLVSLGVDAATAAQDACRIEHVLSKEAFEAIKRHVESEGISQQTP